MNSLCPLDRGSTWLFNRHAPVRWRAIIYRLLPPTNAYESPLAARLVSAIAGIPSDGLVFVINSELFFLHERGPWVMDSRIYLHEALDTRLFYGLRAGDRDAFGEMVKSGT
jgi:hypothetical protein